MFASLKNKIREETGSDLSKLTAKITSSTVQRIDSLRGRGSTTSINSLVSSDGVREDNGEFKSEEDYRRRLNRLEQEFAKKLDEKEKEWRDALCDKDKHVQSLEREKEEAHKQIHNLKDSLKNAEVCKQKMVERQEDKEQIENFQTQELGKVKHLVLLREQELEEKTSSLKEANQQLDKLRSEVNRLRRFEEQLSHSQDDLESLRHSSARDLASLASDLAKREEEKRHLTYLVAVLEQRAACDCNSSGNNDHVNAERKLLEQRLEEAHIHLADIKTSWSDKIASLETQVGRLSRQAAEEGAERRRAVDEKEVLLERVRQLECELECNNLELSNKEAKMKRLTMEVEELSAELKSIRSKTEQEVASLRDQIQNVTTEIKAVRKNLENAESELEKNDDECAKLRISVDSEHQANLSLKQDITRLEKDLMDEKSNSLNVQRTLTRVTAEKNTALLRNAEISQQMELAKQETRRQETEMNDLLNKIGQLEEENKQFKEKETKGIEQELRNTVAVLEEQLSDKNKNIKTLQLRLADMKKTLQQELRTTNHSNFYDIDTNAAILTPSQTTTRHHQFTVRKDDDDVNFTYLKHVIIKFLTSREYEAQHLTRAVATLLKFSPEEEKLLNDTLEWKMSWFGSRPKIDK
ncbi:PREDICTED: golgin subfamily A member 1 isoform X2 [Nicrophorus vespilloides]|uniref:Golgin subfamily A member 1 isoform X2 n=1 Tax=Nicrophorus vespilloides TaxID=110193 RepID=A0ABM1MES1_NICVS|nr:PREDICTED: golgin subfamily A member 1 isoform X2 [Nicrophorus vespilloides]